MAASADLIVNIVTKMSSKGMDEAGKQTSKFKSGLNKASVGAGVALGAIVAFGAGAVSAASDVQQSMGAVESVFGKNAETVKKWADASATSVGLSKNAYMELATVTGAQLKNMGLPMDQVTKKTDGLIKKGADLAATFGGTTADAVGAIGAALRGETDPIERYGVSIKQADIAAQQAAEGTDKLTGSAGKQAKAMALLHLLNKQTAASTGAFAKESDTAAHQSQVAAAQYDDLQATLGEALLPIVTKVTAVLAGLAAQMAKHKTATQIVIGVVAALAVAIIALNLAVTIYTAVTTLAASATIAAWVAAALPIVLVVAAVLAVVAAVVILWKKSKTFRTIVLAVWSAIKTGAAAMGRTLVGAWQAVSKAATTMARVVRNIWNSIRSAASAVANAVRSLWRGVWSALVGFVRAYFNTYKAIFNTMRSVAAGVLNSIRSIASNAFNGVKGAATTAVQQAVSAFSALPGKVKAAFSGAASLLYGIGADIIQGLVNGLNGAAHLVEGAVQAIISKIPKKVRQIMGIASPSKVMKKLGHDIIKGLEQGMADGVAGVQRVTQHAVDVITATIKAATKSAKQARTLTSAAVKSIGNETAALVTNARKRQAVYNAIKKQTGILNQQKQAWDSLKASVAGTAQQFGSFAGAVGLTLADMLTDMTDKVTAVETFQRTLRALSNLGLNRTTLTELATAGPEDAGERARALLAGGQAAVRQVNGLQTRLTRAANTLGSQTADAMYQTGIDATQALLNGLTADRTALERAANRLARNLAAAVRRALAKYTPKPRTGHGRAAPSAASYAAPALATPAARGAGAPGGGTTIVNVNGAVDPDSTARQIRRILDGHDRRVGLRVA